MKECKFCNKTFDDSMSFCPYCAKSLSVAEENAEVCANCGALIARKGFVFCNKCGARLSADKPKSAERTGFEDLYSNGYVNSALNNDERTEDFTNSLLHSFERKNIEIHPNEKQEQVELPSENTTAADEDVDVDTQVCLVCGRKLIPDAPFCQACGTPVVQEVVKSIDDDFKDSTEIEKVLKGTVCINCGAEIIDGAAFCIKCGIPVAIEAPEEEEPEEEEPELNVCSDCGAELEEGANFCTVCGTPVPQKQVIKNESAIIKDLKDDFANSKFLNTVGNEGKKFISNVKKEGQKLMNDINNKVNGSKENNVNSNVNGNMNRNVNVNTKNSTANRNVNGNMNNNINNREVHQSAALNTAASSAPNYMPVAQLKTDRSLLKYILLSLVTFFLYSIGMLGAISSEVNIICSRYDGKKTMNYWIMAFLVAPFTLGIGNLVWHHKICNRMGGELKRRGIDYSLGAKDFWLWGILGSLIIVGPFVFYYKFIKASNLLNEDFNQRG